MASISTDPKGRVRIQFFDAEKKHRHTIRLGKVKEPVAMRYKENIEALETHRWLGGMMDKGLAEWLASLAPDIYATIAKAGWVDVRTQSASTVGALSPE